MQLRKFVGEDTPAVLGSVRSALGSDAIILANRRVGDKIEIIATGQLDDETIEGATTVDLKQEQDKKTASVAAAQASVNENSDGNKTDIDHDKRTVVRNERDKSEYFWAHLSQKASQDASQGDQGSRTQGNGAPMQSMVPPAAESASAGNPESNTHVAPGVEPAKNTKPARRNDTGKAQDDSQQGLDFSQSNFSHNANASIDQRLRRLEVNLWGDKEPVRSQHLQQLLKMGLGAEISVRLVERIISYSSLDDALRQSLSLLVATLPIGADATASESGVTIVTGPPGAGKTTTLVKLATQKILLSGSQSVVLVCADTNRIGAFESLQAYGRLLGVPAVHAHSADELRNLLKSFSHKELILVDHPLPQEEGSIPILSADSLDYNSEQVRQLLVLPSTLQTAVVEEVIHKFSKKQTLRCVLTHLDRPSRLGELFTTLIRHHVRTAYWSDNAQVQIPLQRATAQVLVAAAVAMAKKHRTTVDEKFYLDLIQPPQLQVEMPRIQMCAVNPKAQLEASDASN